MCVLTKKLRTKILLGSKYIYREREKIFGCIVCVIIIIIIIIIIEKKPKWLELNIYRAYIGKLAKSKQNARAFYSFYFVFLVVLFFGFLKDIIKVNNKTKKKQAQRVVVE